MICSPDASAVLFRVPVWVTGNPIGTDPDPNVTPPAANRIITMDANAILSCMNSSGFIRVYVVGGTSVSYASWRFDPFSNLWRVGGLGVRTITLASSNIATISNTQDVQTPGCKFFLRVTAMVGAVTAFGYGFA